MDEGDFVVTDLGPTGPLAPDVDKVLDEVATFNPLTQEWTDIPEDVAKSLRGGKLGLGESIIKRYRGGEAQVVRMMTGAQWLRGEVSDEDAIARGNIELLKVQVAQAPAVAWREGFGEYVARMIKDPVRTALDTPGAAMRLGADPKSIPFAAGEAAQMLPFSLKVAEGAAEQGAIAGTLGMGGAALLFGASGVGTPAAAAVVATFMKSGMAYGALKTSFDLESGATALELLDEGVKPETVRKIAPVAGVFKAALEVVGFNYLTAPARRVVAGKLLNSAVARKAMARWLTNYTKELGAEIGTELAQETVDIWSKNAASVMEENPDLFVGADDAADQLVGTLIASAAGMSIIKAPGAAMEAAASRKPKLAAAAAPKPGATPVTAPGEVDGTRVIMTEEDTAQLPVAAEESATLAEETIAEETASQAVEDAVEVEGLDLTDVESRVSEAQDLVEKGVEPDTAIDTAFADSGASAEFVGTLKAEGVASPELSETLEKAVRGKELTAAERRVLREELPETAAIIDELEQVEIKLQSPALKPHNRRALTARKAMLTEKLGVDKKTPGSAIKTFIREKTGQTTPKPDPQVSQLQAFKESLRAQGRAATAAVRMTRKNIAAAQTALLNLVRESPLDAKDKAKFLTVIRDVQTQGQLARAIPVVEERIDALHESAVKRRLRDAVKKELKSMRPRKQSGRLVGRFTAEMQDALSRVRAAGRLNQQDAAKKLIENLEAAIGTSGAVSAEQAYENQALSVMAQGEGASVAEWDGLLRTIKALKGEGRMEAQLRRLNEQAKLNLRKRIALKIVDAGKGTDISETRLMLNRMTAWSFSWPNLMNKLSLWDPTPGKGKGVLNQIFDVAVEETAEKKGLRLAREATEKMMDDAFGTETPRQRETKWAEDNKHFTFEYTDASGKEVKVKASRAAIRKKWMELQDETLRETFFDKDAMAFTGSTVKKLEAAMTPADFKFAQAQLDFLREYHAGFNDTYSEMNGVNLPFIVNYSPIVREHFDRDADENAIFGEVASRISITPSAGKARVKNLRKLAWISDLDTLSRHVRQVEHYKAWARRVRQLNSVFGDGAIRNAISTNFDPKVMTRIDHMVKNFTRGGIDRSNDTAAIDLIKTNFTVSVLAGKAAILAKQLVSFVAYADAIPAKDFVVGLADFAKNPKQAIETLGASEVMRNRGISFTPETAEVVNTPELRWFRMRPSTAQTLLTMTRWGDRGAIYAGGWSVYQYHIKQGKTHAQALKAFEDATTDSQQSADLSQINAFQSGNSLQRLMMAFMTSPSQYYQKEAVAIETYLQGRAGVKETAKTLLIYHAILPMLFQWVSDGFEFRPKEQIRAGLVGSINGVVILGSMVHAIVSAAMGMRTYGTSNVLDSAVRDLIGAVVAMRNAADDEWDLETVLNVMKEAADPAGLATGMPTKFAANARKGLWQMFEAEDADEWRKGALLTLGWPEFVAERDREAE